MQNPAGNEAGEAQKLCPKCGNPLTNYIDYGPGMEIDNWECDFCPDEDVADNGQWLIDKINVSMDMNAGPAYTVPDLKILEAAFPARVLPRLTLLENHRLSNPSLYMSEFDPIVGNVKLADVYFKGLVATVSVAPKAFQLAEDEILILDDQDFMRSELFFLKALFKP